MRPSLSRWDFQTRKNITILFNGLCQRREERITAREWRCRLTNDGAPSPQTGCNGFQVQGLKAHLSALNCSYEEIGNT